MKFWMTLKRFYHWLINRGERITAIRFEELPDTLERNKLYVIGEHDFLWFAAILCPCGCDEILYMGLMPDQRPKWTITFHNNHTVSLHPSIWRRIGCRSHFWVKRGQIIWCHLGYGDQ